MTSASIHSNDVNEVVDAVARNLKRIRTVRGVSLSALARRSGVARATLYQLENAQGNPTIDTLFAIASSLGVPLSELIAASEPPAVRVVRASEGTTVGSTGVTARLLQRFPGDGLIELYELIVHPGEVVKGDVHPAGVLEHVLVHTGRLMTGLSDEPVELTEGDYICFRGDRAHQYEALGGPVRATLLMFYPPTMGTVGVGDDAED